MTLKAKLSSLNDLVFDNRFTRELPADKETINNRRQVFNACYSRVLPTAVVKPQKVAYSKEVAELLNLGIEACESNEFTELFAGNKLLANMDPYAMCYGGHQFGNWAGQLGDGRAINLGEILNHKNQRWALQLKGAGPTPYSRTADGLAVLRSSVREFLCSEAMHHLGVPTSRALSLIMTGENVIRDMFYNGNPKAEPGAVVCRVAPSFTRFGNFQILTARRDIDLLKKLVDYTIRTDFPHLGEPSPTIYIDWFTEVCKKTAEMIVHWQRVGFVHGVMNTDNMSILGLTIDYGPYGWLENFDPNWTPNTSDSQEQRYRFGNQPQIAFWNLGQLANSIYPLIEQTEPFHQALNVYTETFEQGWHKMMASKLGFKKFDPETDEELCSDLFVLLQLIETDMSIFYRQLAKLNCSSLLPLTENDFNAALLLLSLSYYIPKQITPSYKTRLYEWLNRYCNRVQKDKNTNLDRQKQMNTVNPKYVLRNYLAQLAIDQAEQGNFVMVNELLELLRKPYDEQPDKEKLAAKRPDWARQRAGCSMLSCSS